MTTTARIPSSRKHSSRKHSSRKHSSRKHSSRKHSSKEHQQVRHRSGKFGVYKFADYPEFEPNLSPRDIFKLGSFGGTYWRPIKSKVTNTSYRNVHLRYKAWFADLPPNMLVSAWSDYDVQVNKYKVKVGTTLEYWEEKHWISPSHPYGWVHWYCDFFMGKRSEDDARQVSRWLRTAGPNSRFRKRLLNMMKVQANPGQDPTTISPKIRQTLQHWAVAV
jgi:hypothetical protein